MEMTILRFFKMKCKGKNINIATNSKNEYSQNIESNYMTQEYYNQQGIIDQFWKFLKLSGLLL